MKFLVVTKSKLPFPPEMALGLIEAAEGWIRKHSENGKMEQVWGFAGLQGGGGILNVASLDELDAIMTEFPFGPFSEIEVYGLADVHKGMEVMKQAVRAMTPPNR